jgi:hypothetical protein
MGLTPTHWGPYFWGTIHITCLGAPDVFDDFDKQAYANFINTLPFVLPCGSCGKHFYETLQLEPVEPALTTKYALFEWSVKVHNIVNKRLGKPEKTLDESLTYWSKVCLGEIATCPPTAQIRPQTKKGNDNPKAWLEMVAILIIGVSVGGGLGYMYGKRLER